MSITKITAKSPNENDESHIKYQPDAATLGPNEEAKNAICKSSLNSKARDIIEIYNKLTRSGENDPCKLGKGCAQKLQKLSDNLSNNVFSSKPASPFSIPGEDEIDAPEAISSARTLHFGRSNKIKPSIDFNGADMRCSSPVGSSLISVAAILKPR
uniref:Uncharacterized protein n=1 Tax=Oryza glumipatula TaxID=40148 RepID=A0A0E0BPR1_9ORYZ